MNSDSLQACIDLGRSIRLGKIYPTAIEIVDSIEDITNGLPKEGEISSQMVLLIKLVMMRQICQDWLGVADFLEYDLPDILAADETRESSEPPPS
ncbi:MAG: hypothetical protein K2W33_12360 [Burkholderiales bacterium]|nr:hypothetical protein [Burkholderiales bacterium]